MPNSINEIVKNLVHEATTRLTDSSYSLSIETLEENLIVNYYSHGSWKKFGIPRVEKKTSSRKKSLGKEELSR